MSPQRPVITRFHLEVEADLETTWAVFSDTDRFNRAAGLGMRFEETTTAEGRYAPTGRMRRLGTTQTWEELPWRYQAPRWFQAERRFVGGPVDRVVAELSLEPDGARTRLSYQVAATPRFAAARPLLILDSRTATRPQLQRALLSAKAVAEAEARGQVGPAAGYDPPPPPLSAAGRQRLQAGLAAVDDPALSHALAELVATAPLDRQARIQADLLAARAGRSLDATVRALLQATRGGALAMRWDLRCPSCRAPKRAIETLSAQPFPVHCASCDVRYDGTFPDAVALSFRPAPAVRDFETPVDCLFSPQRTPHVRLRAELEAHDLGDWEVPLSPGAWTLDLGRDRVSLEVGPAARSDVATVQVGPDGVLPALLAVRPGVVRLVVRSRLAEPVAVVLRQRVLRRRPLTLGRLLAVPDALDLLPAEALAPGLRVEAGTGTVLAVDEILSRGENLDALVDQLEDHGPATLRRAGGAVLATWSAPGGALAAARRLVGHLGLAAGLDQGPVLVLREGAHVIPCGAAVDRALDVARGLGAGRVGLSPELAARPEVPVLLDDVQVVPTGDPPLYLLRDPLARDRHVAMLRAAAPAAPPPVLGGRYRLGLCLGSGGQGAVYAVQDVETGQDLVAKLLLPEAMARPRQVQFFVDEARIAATLDHPAIPRVLDLGLAPGEQLWMVMERVAGRTLTEHLAVRGPLPEAEALAITLGILDALVVVHDAGLVHRDLKPDNVMVGEDGQVHLLDLGIAQLTHDDDDPTRRGTVVGTPQYLAPEQLQPPYEADARTDLYALGLVLHTMLAGAPPFTGESALRVAMARLYADPPPLAGVSPEVQALVRRATARDPGARFQDAREAAAAARGLGGTAG